MCFLVRQSNREGWLATSFFWHLLDSTVPLFLFKTSEDLISLLKLPLPTHSHSTLLPAPWRSSCGFPCHPVLPGPFDPNKLWSGLQLPLCRILFSAMGLGKFMVSSSSSNCSVSLWWLVPPSIPMALKLGRLLLSKILRASKTIDNFSKLERSYASNNSETP